MQVLDFNKLCCNVCNKHYTKKSSLDKHKILNSIQVRSIDAYNYNYAIHIYLDDEYMKCDNYIDIEIIIDISNSKEINTY